MINPQEERNTFRSSQEFKDHHPQNNPSKEQLLDISIQVKQFTYLTQKNNRHPFTFNKETIHQSSIFSSIKDKYSLFLMTTIEKDSGAESTGLNQSIDSIILNLPTLNTLNIAPTNLLYIIFIQEINYQENYELFYSTLPKQYCINGQLSFNAAFMSYTPLNSPATSELNLLFIHNPKLTTIESLDLFYNNLLPSIKSNDTTVHNLQLSNGIILPPTAIHDMINICKKKTLAVLPQIQTVPTGLYAKIDHFAQYQYTIYDLPYYLVCQCLPMNHDLLLMKLDPLTMIDVKAYFNQRICQDADSSYHDMFFGLYLHDMEYNICYAKDIICNHKKDAMTFGEMMYNQFNRSSGLYASIFNLKDSWVYCGKADNSCLAKIMVMFLFMGMFFDFCFPSMLSLIIYTIFNEAFESNDQRVSLFLTGFYIVMTMLSVTFSLIIKKRPHETEKMFLVLYGIFTVFYWFVIVCAVPAIHFVNINKRGDRYVFNIGAFVAMIVVNVFFGILPLLINIKSFGKNIVSALLYIVIGIPGYTTVFLNHSLVNCSDLIGTVINEGNANLNGKANESKKQIKPKGKNKQLRNYRKMLMFVLYICTNAFFLCIIFFMTNRTMRVNAVYALAIIYTIYNCMKMLGVISGLFRSPKKDNEIDMLPDGDNDDEEDEALPNKSKGKTQGKNNVNVNDNAKDTIPVNDKIQIRLRGNGEIIQEEILAKPQGMIKGFDFDDKDIDKGINTEPPVKRVDEPKKRREMTEERTKYKGQHLDNSMEMMKGRIEFKDDVDQLKEKSIELNFESDMKNDDNDRTRNRNPMITPDKERSVKEDMITKDDVPSDWIGDIEKNKNEPVEGEGKELKFSCSSFENVNMKEDKVKKENGINEEKETVDQVKINQDNEKELEMEKLKEIEIAKALEIERLKEIETAKALEIEMEKANELKRIELLEIEKLKEIEKAKEIEEDKVREIELANAIEIEKAKEIEKTFGEENQKEEFVIDADNQAKIDNFNFDLIDSKDFDFRINNDIITDQQNGQDNPNTDLNPVPVPVAVSIPITIPVEIEDKKDNDDHHSDKQSKKSSEKDKDSIKEIGIDNHSQKDKDTTSHKDIDTHSNKNIDPNTNINPFQVNQPINELLQFEIVDLQNPQDNPLPVNNDQPEPIIPSEAQEIKSPSINHDENDENKQEPQNNNLIDDIEELK